MNNEGIQLNTCFSCKRETTVSGVPLLCKKCHKETIEKLKEVTFDEG